MSSPLFLLFPRIHATIEIGPILTLARCQMERRQKMSQKMRIKRRENLYWDAQTQTVQEGRPVQKKVAIIEYWTDEEIKEIEEMVTISVNRMMINAETEAEFEGWEFIAAEHMISVDQLRLDIIRKEFSRIIAIEDRIALQVLRGILTE